MTKTKIYAVLLAGTICISLAGCGNTAPVSESKTVQVNAEETADETSGIDISDVVPAEPTVSEEPEPPAESSASEPQHPAEKNRRRNLLRSRPSRPYRRNRKSLRNLPSRNSHRNRLLHKRSRRNRPNRSRFLRNRNPPSLPSRSSM